MNAIISPVPRPKKQVEMKPNHPFQPLSVDVSNMFHTLTLPFKKGGQKNIQCPPKHPYLGSTPHPVTVANEGLGWDSLLKM